MGQGQLKSLATPPQHVSPHAEQQRLYGAVAVTAVVTSGATLAVCYALCKWHSSSCGASVAKGNRTKSSDIYEGEVAARQYMEFHYTPSRESYGAHIRNVSESFDYPIRMARLFQKFLPPHLTYSRGLDLGCATGASVLEMSKYFEGGVIGVDYSEIFIHLANAVLQSASAGSSEKVTYTAPVQGDITVAREVHLPKGIFPERCRFFAGDAMNLFEAEGRLSRTRSGVYPDVEWWQCKPLEQFGGVLCLNLIDRVIDPEKVLRSFAKLIAPQGVLVLADPYSWWLDATPKDKWLGGKDNKRSEDVVKAILLDDFDLLQESDEAFLIRDHVRRYQLGIAHCTVWRRLVKKQA